MKKPPFTYDHGMVEKLSEISFLLGKVETKGLDVPSPLLRRVNQIRTIHSTLAIEGNTLSEGQISAILEGKKVRGKANEILEVKNAISLYEEMDQFDYRKVMNFLKAHKFLMKGLIKSAGRFRTQNVGVLKGGKVVHTGPQPKLVPKLIEEHFGWLDQDKETPLIIKSCISHYEIEFIHPFMDGNGRIGRFWQSLILNEANRVFKYLPIESAVRERQNEYYKFLELSDKQGESTLFVSFMLEILIESLFEFIESARENSNTQSHRLELAKEKFKNKKFSRKEYREAMPDISTATASRDLTSWCERGLLQKEGSRNQTRYYF